MALQKHALASVWHRRRRSHRGVTQGATAGVACGLECAVIVSALGFLVQALVILGSPLPRLEALPGGEPSAACA